MTVERVLLMMVLLLEVILGFAFRSRQPHYPALSKLQKTYVSDNDLHRQQQGQVSCKVSTQDVGFPCFPILTSIVLFSDVRGDVGLFEGSPFEVLLVTTTVHVSLLALLATGFLLITF
jgi:hypothetical protein